MGDQEITDKILNNIIRNNRAVIRKEMYKIIKAKAKDEARIEMVLKKRIMIKIKINMIFVFSILELTDLLNNILKRTHTKNELINKVIDIIEDLLKIEKKKEIDMINKPIKKIEKEIEEKKLKISNIKLKKNMKTIKLKIKYEKMFYNEFSNVLEYKENIYYNSKKCYSNLVNFNSIFSSFSEYNKLDLDMNKIGNLDEDIFIYDIRPILHNYYINLIRNNEYKYNLFPDLQLLNENNILYKKHNSSMINLSYIKGEFDNFKIFLENQKTTLEDKFEYPSNVV